MNNAFKTISTLKTIKLTCRCRNVVIVQEIMEKKAKIYCACLCEGDTQHLEASSQTQTKLPPFILCETSLVPSPLPAAILQWPEKVVWRLWSTFLGLEASSDYVTLVGTARCEICTGKMEVPRCALCSCSVANSSFCRRIESSP